MEKTATLNLRVNTVVKQRAEEVPESDRSYRWYSFYDQATISTGFNQC